MDAPRGGFEGHIDICLVTDGRHVCDVTITSTRPLDAARVLTNRPVEDSLAMLPRLFSLCGVAQSVAGVGAVEQALALSVTPSQQAARNLLVAAEALEQTVLRMGLDWPRLTGATPDVAALAGVRGAIASLQQALYPDGGHAVPGGGRTADGAMLDVAGNGVDVALGRFLLGDDAPARLETVFVDRDGFDNWVASASTPVAAAIKSVIADDAAGFGKLDIETTGETGAFVRQRRHPLMVALETDVGGGLLPRLVARLIELATMPARLREGIAAVVAETSATTDLDEREGTADFGLETARGTLRHTVTVADGRIATYAIAAPTDLNFANEGPLKPMLVGADAVDKGALLRHVHLLVMALDPCVAFDVRVEGGDDA